MKKSYQPKIKNKLCVCKYCRQEFLSAEPRALICDSCKISPALLGECKECGASCKLDKKFCSKSCATRHIHRTQPGVVGYKRGEKNIAKRSDIRKKISAGVTRSYEDPELLRKRAEAFAALGARSDSYRSEQEKQFALFLQSENVGYQREVAQGYMALRGKKLVERQKIVDFILPQYGIYVELTGFIWGSTDNSHRTYFRERLLELASEHPESTYIISTTEERVLPRIREWFRGWVPWNMQSMEPGNNLLILSYQELQDYILARRNAYEDK